MNAVIANMFDFSLYYRENTGCLQCGPFIKVKGPLLLYPK